MKVGKNAGLALFGGSILCNSPNTWRIRNAWCINIDGNRQNADNRIHHSGGPVAHIWRFIPLGGSAIWNPCIISALPRIP